MDQRHHPDQDIADHRLLQQFVPGIDHAVALQGKTAGSIPADKGCQGLRLRIFSRQPN
ncbi:hypothetical protein MPL3356_40329 [Mesorhizobium plurifarium]|uniref:Uncharacterized protein n=1 Tax=Mesorhizobium plurifarium TaxID=69974 RepID=A0A090E817_MESPL|nr:hypothetical protein MPL3356_40329 [Mesorhizobium plurifarium]